MFRRLSPEPAEFPDAAAVVEELRLGELAPADRPYLVLNMVTTADGRVTIGGRSGTIGNAADQDLFHALRTRVDAVMVGAGTIRVERYGRIVRDAARREQRVRAGLEADPLAIVCSASLELPVDLPLLQDPDSRVVIVTASAAALDGVRADVHYLRFGGGVDLRAALARLRDAHGVRAILCEGGPRLNATLVAEGLVDELFLTSVPLLAGSTGALSIVDEAPLAAPAALSLRWLLEHGGELFARYAVGAPA